MSTTIKAEHILSAEGCTVDSVIAKQKAFLLKKKHLSKEGRLKKLEKLEKSIKKHENELIKALELDLGKHAHEAYMTEINGLYQEIRYFRRKLDSLMKIKRIPSPLFMLPARSYIYPEAKGRVLIIGPWNYPITLILMPLIGALAAGNSVLVKPSEFASESSKVLAKLFKSCFSEEEVAVFLGSVECTQALLEHPWDHVFFTGSTQVGKIIAQKAAATLSPTTLELGGKSPVYIDKSANIKLAARRLLWAKLLNVGQTCVAPDYVMVHKSQKKALLKALTEAEESFYGTNPLKSAYLGKIINKKHFDRLQILLENQKILWGGKLSKKEQKMSLTLIEVTDKKSSILMQEEIFGPILPIMTVDDPQEFIDYVESQEKPLALYIYTQDKDLSERILTHLSFGGGMVNDSVLHLANHRLPFGGVGASGQGSYHGEYSFKTFSHFKSVVKNPTWIDWPIRYAPYDQWKERVLKFIT